MWVVFHSTNATIDVADKYKIVDTEDVAKAEYNMLLSKENLYCAGYAPITEGTEPHWKENDHED